MKIFLTLSLLCGLSGQGYMTSAYVPNQQDTTQVTVIDTISAEELFLKEISDKAIAKEERRDKITNDFLFVAVIYLLVDKFFIK